MGTIEQLEALEKAATAGPWEEPFLWDESGLTDNSVRQKCVPGMTWKHDTADICTFPPAIRNRANAMLIPAARNALPALLAVAKAAKAVRAEWTNKHVVNCQLDLKVVELIAALSRLEAQ